MADYIINTEAGYNKVQEAKDNPGQSISMSDGSSIRFNPDTAQLEVTNKYGTNNAYLGDNYGGTSRPASSGGNNNGYGKTNTVDTSLPAYTVGTPEGLKLIQRLQDGEPYVTASDGSIWSYDSNGILQSYHHGQYLPIDVKNSSSGGYGSGGSSGGGSGGISGSILDYLNGLLNGTTDGTTDGATGGTVATPSTSTVVDSALAAKDAYNEQIEAYKKQLLEMQNSKTPSAADQSEYIRQMYDQQLAANKAQLESNYNEGMSSLAGEESNLDANYYEQRRQAQANSDKSQANFNEMANAYGLNTGTGGQAQLARNNQLQSSLTTLGNAEAQNRAEIERQRTLLGQQYQNAIQQAQAENNMELAQALYQEAVRVDNSIIDASKNDSNRALEILNMMLSQISADRNLATEEARQAAEIAAAGGKYGLYGQLYGLSDDVIAELESIYQKELADTEYGRYLDNLLKANEAGVSKKNYGGYSGSSYGGSNYYGGMPGANTKPSSGGLSQAELLQFLLSQNLGQGGISDLMGADKPAGSGTSDELHKESR